MRTKCLPNEMTRLMLELGLLVCYRIFFAHCVTHELDFPKNALKTSSVHGLSVHTVEASVRLANTCTFFAISLETAKKQTGKITKLRALRQGTVVPESKLSKS